MTLFFQKKKVNFVFYGVCQLFLSHCKMVMAKLNEKAQYLS